MSKHLSIGLTTAIATAVLLSAFMLFQVQPLISKAILPWFGGSPTVWTTCMLFFQITLFAGYVYAHLLSRYFSTRTQVAIHVTLTLLAIVSLPIAPSDDWKPAPEDHPVAYILLILVAHLGLPYFLLSANGPLLQAWYAASLPGKSPYRLYALSNIGSLAALLTYPFVVEPILTLPSQSTLWSAGFLVFSLILLLTGVLIARVPLAPEKTTSDHHPPADNVHHGSPHRVSWGQMARWLLLPALACITLLATTNHVCQDMAVVPFLWVVPLSLYLLTFILCFESDSWYRRDWIGWSAVACLVVLSLQAIVGGMLSISWLVAIYFGALFFICMLCHGELVRLRPDNRHLTLFYLMISAGGALGGLTVSLVCPLIFSQYHEMPLALLASFGLAMVVLFKHNEAAWKLGPPKVVWILLGSLLLVVFGQMKSFRSDYIESRRNFYGVLNIGQLIEPNRQSVRTMYHGRIVHGFQFEDPAHRAVATSYYAPDTGAGLAIRRFPKAHNRHIGVVGLGVGTLATYGQPGDRLRFYEINRDVIELADKHFTYLADTPAECEIVLGDARLSLEREVDQKFDILVLDAFSGDAVPTHLLTKEAFELYRRHLTDGGVLAIHISNKHIDLRPVVFSACDALSLRTAYITTNPNAARYETGSQWVLASDDSKLFEDEVILAASHQDQPRFAQHQIWTDHFSNLLEVLK
ncbi:MAG: fused MFS/spermidine synthase [Pirellulaceae bacterium]